MESITSMIAPTAIGTLLPGFAYVLPGLALVRREEWTRADPVELAAVACAGSAAWWACGLWFIGPLGIPLAVFALVSLAAAALILAFPRRGSIAAAVAAWRATPAPALLGLGFVIVIVGTRAIFAFTRLACSVGDMSAHAYMTELLVMRDGLPDTYEPFLPVGGFGSFPPGFHALAAIETLLLGIPTYRSTIHVVCFSLVALTFTLAALLRGVGVGRAGASLGAAGALVLALNPQFFEQWGGAPTLLAAALIFLTLRDGLRLAEPCPAGFLARLGLFSGGALLVHPLPVMSFLYVFPVAAALHAGRDYAAWVRIARNSAVVLAGAGALAVPFFGRLPLSIPPQVAAWAHDWFRTETENALRLQDETLRALGASGLAGPIGLQTWPFYVVTYLGVLSTVLLTVGLTVRWLRERGLATALGTSLVIINVVLFTGGLTETLPLWPSLYPSRVGIWLTPALAIAFAGLGSLASAYVRQRTLFVVGILWFALFVVQGFRLSAEPFGKAYYESAKAGLSSAVGILTNEAVGGAFWVATFSRDNAVLTPDDLRAFAWVREQTPPGSVFATNYGDGGNLIAAVAHRPVINPHFNLTFFYSRELEEWQRLTPINYIYVSSEASPAYERTYTVKALDRDPSVEIAFCAAGACVYKVKRP
jgi:hypothetical protein